MRLGIRGRASKSFNFEIQIGQDNIGSKLQTDDGNIRVKDAFLNWRAAEAFQVVVGQFKVPYLRHNLEADLNQLLVDRATLPTLRPAREASRDLGAMLWGNRLGLQYRLAVFDGSDQELKNSKSSLRGSGRVACNWFSYEPDLSYVSTTIGAKRVLQVAAQADLQGDRLDSRDDKDFVDLRRDYRSVALEAFLEQPFGEGWSITGEGGWVNRRDDYDDPAIHTREIEGYYAQAGLLLPARFGPGRLQIAARHEDYDNQRAATANRKNTTVGGTYFIKGHERKIQLDYTWHRESPTAVENDELRLAVIAVF